ncbi:MAG: cytochrome-c peroxidase [Zetaproteobacteria bacterium]|nr:MAG: cytochrome-c peroxidase [Zetaproteobacteria bacterium]
MLSRVWIALAVGWLSIAHAGAVDLNVEPIQPLEALPVDKARAALGRKLFFDTRLSVDNSISCAHCHDIKDMGGADGLAHSFGVNGREGEANSPTVFNAALNLAQFWDGRAASLEAQIDGPVTGHAEMANRWPAVVARLRADAEYRRAFRRVFGGGITAARIKRAIAEFERTLITTGARFDRYLLGDTNAISAEAKRGYALFKSYGCVACHQGRNVGGNLFQVLGVMGDYFADHPSDRAIDRGRFNVTGKAEDMHVFKVPSLRLAVLTAPYFHDGSQRTLAGAIRTMARYQLGREIPERDLRAIIAFLYSLVGEYQGRSLEPKERIWLAPENFGRRER